MKKVFLLGAKSTNFIREIIVNVVVVEGKRYIIKLEMERTYILFVVSVLEKEEKKDE